MARTQAEIVERYEDVTGEDLFGFKGEVLLSHLDREHFAPYAKLGGDLSDWEPTSDGCGL